MRITRDRGFRAEGLLVRKSNICHTKIHVDLSDIFQYQCLRVTATRYDLLLTICGALSSTG